jgi:hypothetical protein
VAVRGKDSEEVRGKVREEFQNQLREGDKVMRRFILPILVGFFLLCGFSPVNGGEVVFEWDANSESDLAGYRLYQSVTSGVYTYGEENAVGVITVGTEEYTLTMNIDGEFFWVLTAFDTAGNESGPSNEVTTKVNFKPPVPPTGCVLRIP